MIDSSPFSPDAIRRAVVDTLNQAPILPADKRGALVVLATTDGVRAVLASKVNDHWDVAAEAEYTGGEVAAGISVIASW